MKTHRAGRWMFLAALIGLVLAAAPARAALFTNGSFESGPAPGSFVTLYGGNTGIAGWTVGNVSIDYIGSYWQAADGSRSIDLNGLGVGSVSQQFDTVEGQAYRVSFSMAGNPDNLPYEKILTASAGSVSGLDFSFNTSSAGATRADMKWTQYFFNFVALGSSTTLTFASAIGGNYGPALDDVEVSAVPLPGTLALMGSGLLGLILTGARRRSRR